MEQTKIYDIAVIGGGSAGTMAVQRSVLNNDNTLFFPGSAKDKKKSRALWVAKVENMPAHFAYKKGIFEPNNEVFKFLESSPFKDKFHHLKNRGVVKISKEENGVFKLTDNKDEVYFAKFVIICTGVMDVQPEIKGSIETIFPYANEQLADYCLRCDGHHILGKKTGIIGHTSSTAWVAVMLYERYLPPSMTIYTNGEKLVLEGDIAGLVKKYKIEIIEDKILEIHGEAKNKVLEALTLEKRGRVACEFIFISLGMIVYNELAKSLGCDLDDRGFVLTDKVGLTNIAGVYVAGDLRANLKKQIYTAWDSAVDCADHINSNLRAQRRLL